MRLEASDVQARIDAWRQQGADRIDPLRFDLMAAMARRAARYEGALRRRLDARLQELADAYATAVAASSIMATPSHTIESPLKSLLEQLLHAPRLQGAACPRPGSCKAETNESVHGVEETRLPVLDEFQQLWSRIRIDSLLRQCLDTLPEDAGPLHSRVLTYRAMALMRDISPGYLQHFIAYADVLAWMEHLGSRSPVDTGEHGAPSVRKRTSDTRRKRPAADKKQ